MKRSTQTLVLGSLVVLALGTATQASAKSGREKLKAAAAATAASPAATGALSQSEIAAGLEEALASGASRAVNTLGRNDGFWGSNYCIPLPSGLARYETLARQFGQGERVDAFHLSLNRAAEQAVPVAAELLGDSIRAMSLTDAQAILTGGDDAATQYFRRQVFGG